MRFLVLGQSEGGRLVSLEIVTAIAGIKVGRSRKLARVPVGVTIRATREFHLEQSVSPSRDVTFGAFQPCMAALQRIGRRSVLFYRKHGRLPSLYVVTRGALAAIGALGELSVVPVSMAVHALLEGQRLLEIPARMALRAVDADVLAQQRKLRSGVIEVLVDALEGDLLPSTGSVTYLAALRETAAVRVLVAIRTLIEGNANVLRLSIGAVGMALRALHLCVQPGQGIAGLGVIELRDADLLPVDEVMARLALRPQATSVLIFVAGGAGSREPKIAAAQIFLFDGQPILWRDARRIVTLAALQPCVLPFQDVAGLFVVEGLRVPFHEREIFTIVFGVTARAFLARACEDLVSCMQPTAAR